MEGLRYWNSVDYRVGITVSHSCCPLALPVHIQAVASIAFPITRMFNTSEPMHDMRGYSSALPPLHVMQWQNNIAHTKPLQ